MRLQLCANGRRSRGDHPRVPLTPAELAADCQTATALGAASVHVHPRDDHAGESLSAERVDAVLTAIRRAAPELPIGVTTGLWVFASPADRLGVASSWTTLPDFASVNWHEPGSQELVELLLDLGVEVEAGLWTLGDVRAWLDSGLADRCLRALVELPDGLSPADTAREARRFAEMIGTGAPILLHGEGSGCWAAVRFAVEHGLDTRIGLEDTLLMPDGSAAVDNAALLGATLELAKHVGRRRP